MGARSNLHTILMNALGSADVYYQPPEGFKLSYPCIVFERDQIQSVHADNKPYKHQTRYSITLISFSPDDKAMEAILNIPTCKHERHFVNNNLHHDIFSIIY